MNSSGDAAESIVRMSLQGTEVALRITGAATKNVIAALYALSQDKQKVKGRTKLENMLKSGKELKVFSVKEEDLKKFTEESKRYGVLFCALVDKKHGSIDGMIDVMVRAEDASKINRIVERFNLATVDTASIKNEIQKSKNSKAEADKGVIIKSVEEKLVDDILSKPIAKESNEMSNPELAKMEKNPPLEPTLDNKKADVGTKSEKPSVREEIKTIKEEQKAQAELAKSDQPKDKPTPNKTTKHQQPKNKSKKSKERGN